MKEVGSEEELQYSAFKQKIKAGQVVDLTMRADLIRGEYKDGKGSLHRFHTIPLPDPSLVSELEENHVKNFQGEADRSWLTAILVNLGWAVLFIFIWWVFFIRQVQMGGKQAIAFGRSKAKLQNAKAKKYTFADVAGCDEAKEE